MVIITGLIIFLFLLIFYAKFEGHLFSEIFSSALLSGKKSFVVLKIFILIGAITSSWMISGTIPTIVYYGLKFMSPEYYFVSAFIITSCVSFLLGSSFGTVGTIGIVLITIGRGLNADLNIAGGAILSGAFFGDRCSPVSSSASLIATLTDTELYKNIKNMFSTGAITFILSCALLFIMPKPDIISTEENLLISEIMKYFKVELLSLIPAILILICGSLRVNVKLSMALSVFTAVIIAIFLQNISIITTLKTLVLGYTFPHDGPLSEILKGGGVISMMKASFIIFISCLISGVLDIISLISKIKDKIETFINEKQLFLITSLTAFVSSCIGCNQSISIVLTESLMKKAYLKANISKENLALHIENTSVVLAPLIPWNIASLIPMTIIGVTGLAYLKYSFFLYLLPLVTFITLLFNKKQEG